MCIDSNGKLGGTIVTMNEAVRNCVEECKISVG